MSRIGVSLIFLILPTLLVAQSSEPTSSAQAEAAALIYTLSNTFERDSQFSDAFAPDFSLVQTQEPDKSVLFVQGCTVTALMALKERALMPPLSGEFQTVGITVMFDLSFSEIVPNTDGALYSYNDGGFFEPDKPQEDSAQTVFALGQIRFGSTEDVSEIKRQTVPNVLSLENVGTGPILNSTVDQEATFVMPSAVSKARMQALVDAITFYRRDFCTLAS